MMTLCYSNNGNSMRAVDQDYQLQDGEAVFDHYATDDELAAAFTGYSIARQAETVAATNDDIKSQLAELDAKSVRALHEAVLALVAAGAVLPAEVTQRLQDLETQKQGLRAKLV